MNERRKRILQYIIEQFVEQGKPISSGSFIENNIFNVSSATIRNEMANLEKEGFIQQPHTSAGRIPTASGYQHFIKEIMQDIDQEEKNALWKLFTETSKQHYLTKAREQVKDGISILSKLTDNVAFATIPENKETLYLGIARFLQQPEFIQDSKHASSVIEVLESGFGEILESADIPKNEIGIYISDKSIFPQFDSCSIMCIRYHLYGYDGILGILGPMRMNYPRNKVLIEYTKLSIEGQKLLS